MATANEPAEHRRLPRLNPRELSAAAVRDFLHAVPGTGPLDGLVETGSSAKWAAQPESRGFSQSSLTVTSVIPARIAHAAHLVHTALSTPLRSGLPCAWSGFGRDRP